MSTEENGNVELPVDQDGIRGGVQTKLTELAEGEIGPQRHLLCNPNSSRAPEMVTLSMARPTILVPMPAIWPVFSSPSIHQGDSPHSGLVEATGDEDSVTIFS